MVAAWGCGKTDGLRIHAIMSSFLVVFSLPLGVGALKIFDGVFVEDPEAGGDFVDQVDCVLFAFSFTGLGA
jgi:hypothetical protein